MHIFRKSSEEAEQAEELYSMSWVIVDIDIGNSIRVEDL